MYEIGRTFFWIAGLGLVALSGCKPEISADLYVGDLYEAYDSGEAIKSPIVIAMPIQSAAKCQESRDKIVPIMNSFSDSEVVFRSCEEISGELFDRMLVETDIDIISVDRSGGASFSGLGAVLIGKRYEDVDVYKMYFVLNGNFEEMVDAIDREFPIQSARVESIDFRININNDTRQTVQLVSGRFFINDEPVLANRPYSLARRDELRIASSDIAAVSLVRDGYVEFGWVAAAGSELPESWRYISGLFNEQPWLPEN